MKALDGGRWVLSKTDYLNGYVPLNVVVILELIILNGIYIHIYLEAFTKTGHNSIRMDVGDFKLTIESKLTYVRLVINTTNKTVTCTNLCCTQHEPVLHAVRKKSLPQRRAPKGFRVPGLRATIDRALGLQ